MNAHFNVHLLRFLFQITPNYVEIEQCSGNCKGDSQCIATTKVDKEFQVLYFL